MSIEKVIEDAIGKAISNIEISVRLDADSDLEVSLIYGGQEISQSYVALDGTFMKIEP